MTISISKNENDSLKNIRGSDLKELLNQIENYYLEYRKYIYIYQII